MSVCVVLLCCVFGTCCFFLFGCVVCCFVCLFVCFDVDVFSLCWHDCFLFALRFSVCGLSWSVLFYLFCVVLGWVSVLRWMLLCLFSVFGLLCVCYSLRWFLVLHLFSVLGLWGVMRVC